MKKLFSTVPTPVYCLLVGLAIVGLIQFGACTEHPPTTTETPSCPQDSILAVFEAAAHDILPCSPPAEDIARPRNVGIKGTYWQKQVVTVSFQPGVSEFYKYYVKKHAVKWSKYANLDFQFLPTGQIGDIRVGNDNSGSWSHIGTNAKYVSIAKASLNLGWADSTGRTCIHEFGHAIGLMHEQTLIPDDLWDKPVIYADLAAYPNYWSKATVDANMFSGFNAGSMDSIAFDGGDLITGEGASVMLYDIKASWTKNKKGFRGGIKISVKDGIFVSRLYPGRGPIIPPNPGNPTDIIVPKNKADAYLAAMEARLAEYAALGVKLQQTNAEGKTILKK